MSVRKKFFKQKRWNRIGLVVALLALPFGLAAYFGGKPLYHAWKQQRMLKVAEGCAARGDDRGAMSSFRIALAADPGNSETWRALGEFLDSRQPGAGLGVWERLAAAEPARAELRYRAVRDALINRDGPRARANLNAVPQADRESSEYRLLEARTLIAENQLVKGGQALAQIVRDEGPAGEAGFELDRLQLLSRNSAMREQAEARLRERIGREAPQTTQALRAIIAAEMTNGAYALADADAEQLLRRPDADGGDYTRFLELEFQTHSLSLSVSLKRVLTRALEHPDEIGPILAVFQKWGKSTFAMEWLKFQPAEKLEAEPIRRARIWMAFTAHDTEQAFTLLGTGSNALSAEKVADLRRIYAEFTAGDSKAFSDWNAFLAGGDQDMDWLSMMSGLAAAWEWPEAQESACWALTNVAPQDPQVWRRALYIAAKRQDTAAILRAASGLAKADPNLLEARTLSLSLEFLLGYGAREDLLRAAEADAAVSQAPETQMVYAMFLTAAGRNREAVAVADKVAIALGAEAALRQRIYLGYIYAAAGNSAKARDWLVSQEAARRHVLPEELAFALKAAQLADESAARGGNAGKLPAAPPPRDYNPSGSQSVIGLRNQDGTQLLGGKDNRNIDGFFLPAAGGTPSPGAKGWPEN